ncbi:unnamed protein product [Polarella glacialis]|uniref:Hcy-binding domain-containing protein n=1 Tax=Polarella glacialis TaxID=89957 RepID=A0A813FJU2_POLGL|nr:unnamed protein product [Polarella glacialis]
MTDSAIRMILIVFAAVAARASSEAPSCQASGDACKAAGSAMLQVGMHAPRLGHETGMHSPTKTDLMLEQLLKSIQPPTEPPPSAFNTDDVLIALVTGLVVVAIALLITIVLVPDAFKAMLASLWAPAAAQEALESAGSGPPLGALLGASLPELRQGDSIVTLFEARAHESPNAIAVVEPGAQGSGASEVKTTYRELDELSATLARALTSAGVGEGDVVALLLPTSRQMLVATLGVMRAGATWLPVDASAPASRLQELAQAAGARLAVAMAGSEKVPGLPLWTLDFNCHLATAHAPPPLPRQQEVLQMLEGSAAIFYTSGSTGMPKAVVYGRDTLLHGALTFANLCDITRASCVLVKSPTIWAVCEYEMFAPLIRGATAVVDADCQRDIVRLSDTLVTHNISVLLTSAPVLQLLVGDGSRLPALRHVVNCGAALPLEICQAAQELLGATARIHNMYGCTETPCIAWTYSAQQHPGGAAALAPAGQPMPGADVHLLIDCLHPVRLGQVGEICFGGRFLSRGYLGDAELTSKKFVAGPENCGLIYRSGDLGRWIEDPATPGGRLLQVQGRLDRQLNIKGIRVAPEEVEGVIMQAPGVKEVAVVESTAKDGSSCIAACVVGLEAAEQQQQQVQEHCKTKLPSHMRPALVLVLDSLPKLGNGKIDLQSLAEKAAQEAASRDEEVGMVRDSLGRMRQARGNAKAEMEVMSAARALAAAGIITYHWYWLPFSGGAGCWNGNWIQTVFAEEGPVWFQNLVWGLMMSSWKLCAFVICAAYADRKAGEEGQKGQLRQEMLMLFLLLLTHNPMWYSATYMWRTLAGNHGYTEYGVHRWYLGFFLLCRGLHRFIFMPLLADIKGRRAGSGEVRVTGAVFLTCFAIWFGLGWPHADDVPNMCRGFSAVDHPSLGVLLEYIFPESQPSQPYCPLFGHGREAVGYFGLYALTWWSGLDVVEGLRSLSCKVNLGGPLPWAMLAVASHMAVGYADRQSHILSPSDSLRELLCLAIGTAQVALMLMSLGLAAKGPWLRRSLLTAMGSYSLGAYALHYYMVVTIRVSEEGGLWKNGGECIPDGFMGTPSIDHGMLFFRYMNYTLIPSLTAAVGAIGDFPGCGFVKLAVLFAYPAVLMLTLAPLFQHGYIALFDLLEYCLTQAVSFVKAAVQGRLFALGPVAGGVSASEAWRRWRFLRATRCDQGLVVCLDGGTGSEVERAAVASGQDLAVNPSGWSCVQWRTHPSILKNVHLSYLKAGAEIVIANTYATNRHIMTAAGYGEETEKANRECVRLACEARQQFLLEAEQAPEVMPLVAGSMSCHPPGMAHGAAIHQGKWPAQEIESFGYHEQGRLIQEAGAETIFVEMVWDWSNHGQLAVEGANAAGIPVAVCLAVFDKETCDQDRPILSDGTFVEEVARELASGRFQNVEAIMIHHTKLPMVHACLRAIRRGGWTGPLGCYPDHGTFKMPCWVYDELAGDVFVDEVSAWVKETNCTLVGGCCGIGPETIKPLSKWCHSFNCKKC